MATLAIRKTAWNSFSASNRVIISNLDERLALGNPAEFQEGTIRWLVFDDHRFSPLMVGRLGVVFANPSKVRRPRAALDLDVILPDNVKSLQEILNAQGAPASVKMMSGIPDNWIAV